MSKPVCNTCGQVMPEVEVVRNKFPRKTLRDRKEFDNTYHPGVEAADLVHDVHWVTVGERRPKADAHPRHSVNAGEGRRNVKQLCHNCGWDTAKELSDGYTSRLKVLYIRDNSAIWELGPNGPWMIKDEPNCITRAWGTDYIAQQFLRKQKPNIPLVEMHRFGGPDDKFHFTIMARAKGSTMSAIWHTLTQEQKGDVCQDLKNSAKEWRQITSPHMQRVDGSELLDPFIGTCTGRGCIKTGLNEEEWLENLTMGMRKGFLWNLWMRYNGWDVDPSMRALWIEQADEEVARLKANFPRGGPYVLTHGDLHMDNIFISDENEEKKFRVSAIIDWELAGFFPWWAENIRAAVHNTIPEYWNMFYPEYEPKDVKKISQAIESIRDLWRIGGDHTMSMHKPDQANRWYRPPFCACTPFGQEYRDNELGWEDEHLDIFDVDSTDSEDEEEDGFKKFPKTHRDFLRWFNEINNYKSKRAADITP